MEIFFMEGNCGACPQTKKEYIVMISSLLTLIEGTISLQEAILSRTYADADDLIYAYHVSKYGTYYKPPNKCLHPKHIQHKKRYVLRPATEAQYCKMDF